MCIGGLWMSVSDPTWFARRLMGGRTNEASERLGIGARQFRRLVVRWKRDGAAGLVSWQRGRLSHNRLPDEARDRIIALLRDKYPDLGPTLASEKLLELDGIAVSRETIRRWQMELKLWKPERRRARRVFTRTAPSLRRADPDRQ
jgi:transposase